MGERVRCTASYLTTSLRIRFTPPPGAPLSAQQVRYGTVWVTLSEVEDKQLLCVTRCWVTNTALTQIDCTLMSIYTL